MDMLTDSRRNPQKIRRKCRSIGRGRLLVWLITTPCKTKATLLGLVAIGLKGHQDPQTNQVTRAIRHKTLNSKLAKIQPARPKVESNRSLSK